MAIDDGEVVRIVVAGQPEPYRERQRVFQKDRTGKPLTYSYKTGSTRQYQNWLRDAAQQAMDGRKLFDCAVVLTMTAYMPIPSGMRKADRLLAEREMLPVTKRPDTTQLLKAAEDAFNQVVWTDDSRVSDHHLRRRYSPRPRLEIEVRPVPVLAKSDGTPANGRSAREAGSAFVPRGAQMELIRIRERIRIAGEVAGDVRAISSLAEAERGHGHVRPVAILARCGGPARCKICELEQALVKQGLLP